MNCRRAFQKSEKARGRPDNIPKVICGRRQPAEQMDREKCCGARGVREN